ncbi:MAG: hypothetical protein QNJ15_04315 [Erythrobacter sp.]|nr:hypothetical protein [Erythrobacter sp.]
MPEWLFATLFVGGFIVIVGAVAWRNTKRQLKRLVARRPSPSKDEFLEMMKPDVSREASEFIWDAVRSHLDYFDHALTPHPDDDLVDELPIADEEWSMDWPREWAERSGFHESNFHDWPKEWPVTIRNYGRWLDMGPDV